MQKQSKNHKRYSEIDINYPLDRYDCKHSYSNNDDNIFVPRKIMKKPSKIKIYVPIEVEKNRFCKVLEKVKTHKGDHLLKITQSKQEIEMDENEGNGSKFKSINKRCRSSYDIKNLGYEKKAISADSIQMKQEQLKKRRKEYDDWIYEENINYDNGSIKCSKKRDNKTSARRSMVGTSSHNSYINDANDDNSTSEGINNVYKNDLKYQINEIFKPEILQEIITPLKEFLETSITEYRNQCHTNSCNSNTLNNEKNLKINKKFKTTPKSTKASLSSISSTKRSLNDKKQSVEIENIKNDLKNFQLKILHKFEQQSNHISNSDIMKNTNNKISKNNSPTSAITNEKVIPQLQHQQPQLLQPIQPEQNQFKPEEQIDYNNDYCRKCQSLNKDFLKNQYQYQNSWNLQNQQFQHQLPQQYQQNQPCQPQQHNQEQMQQQLLLKQCYNSGSGSLNPSFPINYNQFAACRSDIDSVGNSNTMTGGGCNRNGINSLKAFYQQNQQHKQEHPPLINANKINNNNNNDNNNNNSIYDSGRDLREFESQLQQSVLTAGLPNHRTNKQQIGDGKFPKSILKMCQKSPDFARKKKTVESKITKKLPNQSQNILDKSFTTATKEQPYYSGYTPDYAKQLFMCGSDDSSSCSNTMDITTKSGNSENFLNLLNITSEKLKTNIKQHPYKNSETDNECSFEKSLDSQQNNQKQQYFSGVEEFLSFPILPNNSLNDCSKNYDLQMKNSYKIKQQKNNEINNNNKYFHPDEEEPKNKSFSYYNLYDDSNVDDDTDDDNYDNDDNDNDDFNFINKDDYTTHGMFKQQNPISGTSSLGSNYKSSSRSQLPFETHFKVSDNIVNIIRKLRKTDTTISSTPTFSKNKNYEKSYLPDKPKQLHENELGIQEEKSPQQQLKRKQFKQQQKQQPHINSSKLLYPVEALVYYPGKMSSTSCLDGPSYDDTPFIYKE